MSQTPDLDEEEFDGDGEDDSARDDLRTLGAERSETPEWQDKSQRLISEARQAKLRSAALRESITLTKANLLKQVAAAAANTTEQLKRRVADTTTYRSKFEKRLQTLAAEFEALARLRQLVQQQIVAREAPLQTVDKRLRLRAGRASNEQVYDEVERALQTEYDDLRKSVEALHTSLEQLDNATHKLQATEHQLKAAIEDKARSHELDQDCIDIPLGRPLKHALGIPKLESVRSTPKAIHTVEAWKRDSDRVLDDSVKMEQIIVRLKKNVKAQLGKLRDRNQQSKMQSEHALRNKMAPGAAGSRVHSLLAKQINDIKEEMDQIDRAKGELMLAIQSKEKPLALVQKRLAIRMQRPNREAIRDPVEQSLEEEMESITQNMEALNQKVKDMEKEQRRLQEVRNHLLDELHVKTQSVSLDRTALEMLGADSEADTTLKMPFLSNTKKTESPRQPQSPRTAVRGRF